MNPSTYVHDRALADDAIGLIDSFGAFARDEARLRASSSRDRGNIIKYCRWRQVERLIGELDSSRGLARIH